MTSSAPEDGPFDPGLQPERTLLAWRRTALALGLGGVVSMRFTAHDLGVLSLLLGLAGMLMAAVAYIAASVRYRRAHERLVAAATLSNGALSIALLAVAAVLVGAAGMSYVAGSALAR